MVVLFFPAARLEVLDRACSLFEQGKPRLEFFPLIWQSFLLVLTELLVLLKLGKAQQLRRLFLDYSSGYKKPSNGERVGMLSVILTAEATVSLPGERIKLVE
jgi:hypothetical protein